MNSFFLVYQQVQVYAWVYDQSASSTFPRTCAKAPYHPSSEKAMGSQIEINMMGFTGKQVPSLQPSWHYTNNKVHFLLKWMS